VRPRSKSLEPGVLAYVNQKANKVFIAHCETNTTVCLTFCRLFDWRRPKCHFLYETFSIDVRTSTKMVIKVQQCSSFLAFDWCHSKRKFCTKCVEVAWFAKMLLWISPNCGLDTTHKYVYWQSYTSSFVTVSEYIKHQLKGSETATKVGCHSLVVSIITEQCMNLSYNLQIKIVT